MIAEEILPLRRAALLVAEIARDLARTARDVRVIQRERLVTDDGDPAVMAILAGRTGRDAVEATVGVAVGNEACARIVATVRQEAQFELARVALRSRLRRVTLDTAVARPRRFAYAAPDGWQPRVRGAVTEWYPLDFPRRHGVIAVGPAQRLGPGGELAALEPLVGAATPVDEVSFPGPGGLRGRLLVYRGAAHVVEGVVLSDYRFAYPIAMLSDEQHLAQHRRQLARLVDSIEPLALARPELEAAADFMRMWC